MTEAYAGGKVVLYRVAALSWYIFLGDTRYLHIDLIKCKKPSLENQNYQYSELYVTGIIIRFKKLKKTPVEH